LCYEKLPKSLRDYVAADDEEYDKTAMMPVNPEAPQSLYWRCTFVDPQFPLCSNMSVGLELADVDLTFGQFSTMILSKLRCNLESKNLSVPSFTDATLVCISASDGIPVLVVPTIRLSEDCTSSLLDILSKANWSTRMNHIVFISMLPVTNSADYYYSIKFEVPLDKFSPTARPNYMWTCTNDGVRLLVRGLVSEDQAGSITTQDLYQRVGYALDVPWPSLRLTCDSPDGTPREMLKLEATLDVCVSNMMNLCYRTMAYTQMTLSL